MWAMGIYASRTFWRSAHETMTMLRNVMGGADKSGAHMVCPTLVRTPGPSHSTGMAIALLIQNSAHSKSKGMQIACWHLSSSFIRHWLFHAVCKYSRLPSAHLASYKRSALNAHHGLPRHYRACSRGRSAVGPSSCSVELGEGLLETSTNNHSV